jgi:hypothetical protein
MYDDLEVEHVRRRLSSELATLSPPPDLLAKVLKRTARRRAVLRLTTAAGVAALATVVALPLAGVGTTTVSRTDSGGRIVLDGVSVTLPEGLRAGSGTCNFNSALLVWKNPKSLNPNDGLAQFLVPPVEVSGSDVRNSGREMTLPSGSSVCMATQLFGPYHLPPGMSLSSPFVSEAPGQPSTRTSGGPPPTPFDGAEARFGADILAGFNNIRLNIQVDDAIARIPERNGEVDLLIAQATRISASDFKSIVGQVLTGIEG